MAPMIDAFFGIGALLLASLVSILGLLYLLTTVELLDPHA